MSLIFGNLDSSNRKVKQVQEMTSQVKILYLLSVLEVGEIIVMTYLLLQNMLIYWYKLVLDMLRMTLLCFEASLPPP